MGLTRTQNFTVSLDGFATGEGQSLEAPFGHADPSRLMQWAMQTRSFARTHGQVNATGTTGIDDVYASSFDHGIGAEIMGRHKFTYERGPWSDPDWRGWWGDNPPFHTPVFVLTHYPREPIEMEGGTTFHFIDATPAEALAQAKEAAGELDVRIGGGPSVVRDFLAEGLIDIAHIVLAPVLLGRGVRVWDGLESLEERYDIEPTSSPSGVVHLTLTRKP
ncbi:dihydrofolate reductase family protein [Demetria terragena]|uniref:dihydrofolate reductase family protein n=1 Tax=Demetria terragena TaxID=63959 RepID=UPI00037CF2E2|nr:dihydrofolate reductase family protein [Demetria terragena]